MIKENQFMLSRYVQKLRNSKFRHIIWPIRSYELFKFIPMVLLMFSVLLSQNLIRSMKDSLVMVMVGPEVISFIKLWGEMPIGILFVIIYSKMCNVMSTEVAFRYIVVTFVAFFTVFAFVLYPNYQAFHPDKEVINSLVNNYSHLKWFIICWGNWSFILFYIMGELWPVIVFSLLFWQLANKITNSSEAGRFYAFFTLFGQSNLIISGIILSYFGSGNHYFTKIFVDITDPDEVRLKSLMIIIIASAAICLLMHYYIDRRIIHVSRDLKNTKNTKITKLLELNLKDSIKMILSSKYLGYICILIVCYGVVVNLIEGLWMSKVRSQYPTQGQFMDYQGTVLRWTGIATMTFAFIGSSILQRFGWYWGAIITPAVIFIAGGSFFVFTILQDHLEYLFSNYQYLTPLMIIVIIGALQNILGKGAKYSLFDATKEMAYIPLNEEMKAKGKAAVDVVGSKIGKSAGAFLQFLTFSLFPMATYDDISWFLAIFFFAFCTIWLFAVRNLYKDYNKLVAKTD